MVGPNLVKAKLAAGEAVYGCFLRHAAPSVAELLALQGFDFLLFDGEHGPIGPSECEELVRAAELHGIAPIARVPLNERSTILRYLDTGAYGVHAPMIESGAEAEALVRAAKYAPRGIRGLAGLIRSADFGQTLPLAEYVERANAETLTVAHVETLAGLNALAEIAATPDLDVLFAGPSDLSQALGVSGQRDHPTVVAAIEQIGEAAEQQGKALGILVPDAVAAQRWREAGARYIATSFEALVRAGSQGFLAPASL